MNCSPFRDRENRMRSRFLLELKGVKGQISQYGAYHPAINSSEDQQASPVIGSNAHAEEGTWVLFLSGCCTGMCLGWGAVEYSVGLGSRGGTLLSWDSSFYLYKTESNFMGEMNIWRQRSGSQSLPRRFVEVYIQGRFLKFYLIDKTWSVWAFNW